MPRAARDVWRRFREDLRNLPAGTWRRWALTIVVGWLLCAVLSAGMTKLAQARAPHGLQAWDERAIRAVERGPMSFQNAILLESPGNLAYLIPLTTVAAVVAIRWRRPVFAVTILAGYWLARGLVIVGWKLWNRPRPTLIAEGVAAPPLHSFPSGHIVLSLAVYGLLAYAWMRASRSTVERFIAAALALIWCGLTGFARVRLGSHWPSDVIAGAVLGLAWLAVLVVALRRADHGARPLAP